MQRRRLLKWIALVPFLRPTGVFAAGAIGSANEPGVQSAMFRAFIDTLIPADDFSPAASELGIDSRMLAQLRPSRRARRLVLRGLQWLERESKRRYDSGFLQLNQEQREQLVAAAESAAANTLQHRFFSRMRDLSMRAYYSNPASWSGLAVHAPQPLGYLEYTEKP